jgi:hypothetical protein
METAKVDIRKLQLLNDRINQTMEALNQVRLSVFGISHTGQMGQFGGQFGGQVGQFGQVPGQMFGQVPGYGFGGMPQNPYFAALQGGVQGQQGLMPGFSHTSGMNPYAVNPLSQQINPLAYGVNPLPQQFLGAGQWGGPFGGIGQQQGIQGGLGHTSPEALEQQGWYGRTIDPSRIAQTFPFVQWGYSPFAQGYSQFGSGLF